MTPDPTPPKPTRPTKAAKPTKATKAVKTTKAAKSTKAAKATKPAKAADAGAPTPAVVPTPPQPTEPPAGAAEALALADSLLPDGPRPAPTTPEALAVWLAGRRWYVGAEGTDGRAPGRPEVTLATVALPVEPPLAIGLADTDRGHRYQLLVPGPAQADRPDVGDDPQAADALARWVATAGPTTAPAPAGTVAGSWLGGGTALGDDPARPLGGEQSNTSVVVGGTHVLKLFRRLQAGPHPEIEVGRHLAHAADTGTAAPVARLAGWYELTDPAADVTALGVVQELVPGALDAWGLVLSALAADPGAVLRRLHELGSAVAALHGALARPADPTTAAGAPDAHAPEAFGATALDPERVSALAGALADQAERVLATTLDRPEAIAAVAGRAGEVADLTTALVDALGTDLGAAIRHHGDLHLGQVVLGDHGWVILDFEGEPTRPLAERRRRHSPLRDVAGMARSFAYAAATHRRSEGHHLSPGWEPAARAAFLDGYLTDVDPALLPVSAVATRNLLTLLELEKVVYEIDYELAHRPDWVGLPVEGLRRLLAGGRA